MIEDSYNEYLREKIQTMFNKDEAHKFMEESEKSRPTVIRANTLKIKRKDLIKLLSARGMDLDPIEFCPASLVIYKSPVPVGATPEYLTGLYTIQGASSLLPVINLDVQPEEKVLDMCAAPGGKTTHLASLMNNTGVIFAYDIEKNRLKALQSNVNRLGINNCIAVCNDARKIQNELFDKILLDAPCSGTGIISKDPAVKVNRSHLDVKKTVKLQKDLLQKAFKMLKVGGTLVYSTCSVLVDENEAVIDSLLKKKEGAKLLTCTEVGKNGLTSFRGEHFHPSMKFCRRIYPHVHNMDGFFVAKITKYKK